MGATPHSLRHRIHHDDVGVAGLSAPDPGHPRAAAVVSMASVVLAVAVVFDRIRKRTRGRVDRLRETVNQAMVETVPRTLNTGLGAMFILAALAVVGGKSLEDFAIGLLLGLILGACSTVFTAAPLAIWAEERWPRSEPSGKVESSTRTPLSRRVGARGGRP